MKAAPFLVQEVPLPLSPHPAGAAWLKLKATAPPVGGVFDRAGAFYQQTAVGLTPFVFMLRVKLSISAL